MNQVCSAFKKKRGQPLVARFFSPPLFSIWINWGIHLHALSFSVLKEIGAADESSW